MDKRLALAISADDIAPEIAATCFSNLDPVEDNEDDSDSNEEIADENRQRQPIAIERPVKKSRPKRRAENSILRPDLQQKSGQTLSSSPNRDQGDEQVPKHREQQLQHPHHQVPEGIFINVTSFSSTSYYSNVS